MILRSIISIAILAFYAHAELLDISSEKVSFKRNSLEHFSDASQKLTIDEVVKTVTFSNRLRSPFSMGYQLDTTQWFHVSIKNSYLQSQKLVLSFQDGYSIDYLTFYDVRDGKVVGTLEAGRKSQSLQKGAYAFDLASNEDNDIYIKMHGSASIIVNMMLSDATSYQRNEYLFVVVFTLYIGILIALVLFNIFLFIGLKQIEYLYYSLYVIFNIIWLLSISGIPDHLFELQNTELGVYATPFILTFLLLFTQKVLLLREYLPTLYKSLQLVILLALVWIPLSFIFGLKAVGTLITVLSLVTSVGLIFIGLQAVRKKIPAAKYYLLATGAYMVLVTIGILLLFGLVPYNFLTRHSMFLGAVIEGVLLSILLSYRFKTISKAVEITSAKLHKEREDREDILEQRLQEHTLDLRMSINELEKLSYTDTLTGIANRRAFVEVTEGILEQQTPEDLPLFLMLLDLDFFKKINDTYGHDAGDEVLVFVVTVMKDAFSEENIFARLGGEEFGLIIRDADVNAVIACAERIRQLVKEKPYAYEGALINLTLSIGIAKYKKNSIKEWIIESDKALYEAKNKGRDCVVYRK